MDDRYTLLGGGTIPLKVKILLYASEFLKFWSQTSNYNSEIHKHYCEDYGFVNSKE